MPKLFDDEEKSSGLSGDSFLSSLEISPNLDYINSEIINNNEFNLMNEGKNESLIINNKEPPKDIINNNKDKDKDNKPNIIKNDSIEEKKKSKINFFVSKKEDNIEINIENTIKSSDPYFQRMVLKILNLIICMKLIKSQL